MLEKLFFISMVAVTFSYFGYPLSLYFFSFLKKNVVRKKPFYPNVTIIITAFNEEARIGRKLENSLALDYPTERLEILVASDGSTDQTNYIVGGYKSKGIDLLALEERRGKENAQKEAVKRAKGEVLVFTDVSTMIDPGGLKQIIFNFADPSIGCVSSEDRVIGKEGSPGGEGLYVRYEMWLRRLESEVNSLVGLSGSFFAARKEVCQDFSEEMQSDFRTVLNGIKMGLRAATDPEAIGHYQDVSSEKREFDRKVRTVLRGLTVFFNHLEFLNVLKYGLFSYQYFCHKLLRWLVPMLIAIVFLCNLILARQSLGYFVLFIGQLGFYALAVWGWIRRGASSRILLRIPSYFLTVNASILVAWWRYLQGRRVVMWTPSER